MFSWIELAIGAVLWLGFAYMGAWGVAALLHDPTVYTW
jgi:hypothetical protein